MITTHKGTHDILPKTIWKWQKVEATLKKLFSRYNYLEVRTPVFEKTELFARGIGEFTDIVSKEMYTFNDKGDTRLTLRPEFTASVIRSYIQHNWIQDSPIHKVWYFGSLFRQERPQAGRQRQFHQYGIEVIGSGQPEADAEVINIAYTIYKDLGLKNIELNINSIGSNDTRQTYIDVLKNDLKPHLKDMCPNCQTRFEGNTLRLFDCKNEACKAIMNDKAPSILDHLSVDDKEHFETVKSLLSAMDIPYVINPKLVRGLDYYSRTTFEIIGKSLGAQDALCGGGRYDQLVSDLGGKDTPAVGFAAGVERLIIAMENEGLFDDVPRELDLFIAPMGQKALEFSMQLAQSLRAEGKSVDIELLRRSVKAMMREANRKSAKFSMVIGDNEIENGELTLKNMSSSEQIKTKLSDISKHL